MNCLLFPIHTYLHKPNKPKLADVIVNYVKEHTNVDAERSVAMQVLVADFSNDLYILDGGSLLYRVKWEKNKTFGEIASLDSRFVLSLYGKAIIVFDGYSNGPSTKDMTHSRLSENCSQRPVMSKDFLSNLSNKDRFVHLIGEKLEQVGCKVLFAKEDADLDIDRRRH